MSSFRAVTFSLQSWVKIQSHLVNEGTAVGDHQAPVMRVIKRTSSGQKFIRRPTYVLEARVGAKMSTKDSWQGEGINESTGVFVRHDVFVIGEKHES